MSTSVMAATTILKTWSNWTTSRSPRPINGFRESPEAEAEGRRVREHAHCLIAEGWGFSNSGNQAPGHDPAGGQPRGETG